MPWRLIGRCWSRAFRIRPLCWRAIPPVALRDAGDLLPAAAAVFSPWTDLAATGPSLVSNTERDAMFHGASIGAAAQIYLGDASATDPLASPLYADLHG